MWTKEARGRYAPRKDRYPSDLTDAEWRLIEPMIPQAQRIRANIRLGLLDNIVFAEVRSGVA